jgi:hypothetical protein
MDSYFRRHDKRRDCRDSLAMTISYLVSGIRAYRSMPILGAISNILWQFAEKANSRISYLVKRISLGEIRNPKHEARNNLRISISNVQNAMFSADFEQFGWIRSI